MRGSSSTARDQAPIVHRSETEICFRVDMVTPCQERIPIIDARKRFEELMGRSVQVFIHEDSSDVVLTRGGADHSLVSMVYLAFSEHHPLVLTPDAVWITLAQGFAQHINNHANALRSNIVTHKGTVTLYATTWELANSEDWANVIQQWSDGVQPRLPADLCRLMICDFSTTTPIARTVSQVVMLEAFQQYFDYQLMCICGIPTITLKGSVQDWVKIRERVDVMAGFHLEWWTDRFKPIVDGFIDTAKGHPSDPGAPRRALPQAKPQLLGSRSCHVSRRTPHDSWERRKNATDGLLQHRAYCSGLIEEPLSRSARSRDLSNPAMFLIGGHPAEPARSPPSPAATSGGPLQQLCAGPVGSAPHAT